MMLWFRHMRSWAAAIVATCAVLPQCGFAQEVDSDPPDYEGGNIICVVPLTVWVPSPELTSKIGERPVPEEFTRKFEGGPCNTLYKEGLLDWHLSFGDEHTASAALAYYASQMIPEPIKPDKYSAALRKAWALAKPQYVRANELHVANQRKEAFEYTDRNGRIMQFRRILAIAEAHETMLVYYLRAAEFYRSSDLLKRAEALLPVVERRNAFFDQFSPELAALGSIRPDDPRVVDNRSWSLILPYSMAVARYRIEGRDFDKATIRSKVVGPYEKAIEEAAELAWIDQDEDDIHETWLDALKIADKKEDNFVRYAIRVIREDLALGFAKAVREKSGKCDLNNFAEVMILLEQFEKSGRANGTPLGYSRQIWPQDHRTQRLELLISKADCEWPKAGHSTGTENRSFDRDDFWRSMELLGQARQLVQPDESPIHFRRIAERYLELAHLCRASIAEPATDEMKNCFGIIDRRLETYFNVNVRSLDTIATAVNPAQ